MEKARSQKSEVRMHGVPYHAAMPRKKKKPFRAVDAVKALARERIGTPKASRIVQEKKKKEGKHKPKLQNLIDEG